MNLARLVAIVRADLLLRFRRLSTLISFLLLSAFAYVWVPDPATGRALLQINDQRALYNSAAIGMATASLAAMFVGLFGFYVISNAVRLDIRSRCGFILASTPLGTGEYIIGKFLGNLLFLTTFITGFMASSMGMLLIRKEAPLEPLVFLGQYLLLVPPSIVFVAVVAIVFESIPWLSGRAGDVVYFFFWVGAMGAVATFIEKGGQAEIARYFDFAGMAFMISQLKALANTTHMSIGSSGFDPSKGIYVFPGLTLAGGWLWPRIGAMLIPLPLLLVAQLFFHRFDPARVKVGAAKGKRNPIAWLGRLFKPITSRLFAATMQGGTSLFSAARSDAMMSLTAFPLAAAAIVGFAIAGVATAPKDVLPVAFAAMAIAIAGITSRERESGSSALLFGVPLLRERFVAWKFLSTLLVGALFVVIPALRLLIVRPGSAIALLVGVLFIVSAATMLGITTANPKTFIVLFLSFWYLVTNDRGATRMLDFAGFYSQATPVVTLSYAVLSMLLLASAAARHRRELRQRW